MIAKEITTKYCKNCKYYSKNSFYEKQFGSYCTLKNFEKMYTKECDKRSDIND